jgi:hypothetical protein
MPSLEGQIQTERASRYLVQFCKHAAALGEGAHAHRMHHHRPPGEPGHEPRATAEWTDTAGAVTFTAWGRCTLTADASTLALRIEAADEDGLRRIKDTVTRDFARFSSRHPLTVTWRAASE